MSHQFSWTQAWFGNAPNVQNNYLKIYDYQNGLLLGGPILTAKCGLGGTRNVWGGPHMAAKMGPGGPILAAIFSLGDQFWGGPNLP